MRTLLSIYKNTISFVLEVLFSKGCRFTPTCSVYFVEAVEKYGITKGSIMGVKRLSKCHPWGQEGFDPVE